MVTAEQVLEALVDGREARDSNCNARIPETALEWIRERHESPTKFILGAIVRDCEESLQGARRKPRLRAGVKRVFARMRKALNDGCANAETRVQALLAGRDHA